jgi:hypothetical protein
MFKQFIKNNPDAVGLVRDLESYIKKNYKTAYAQFEAVRAAYKKEGLSQEQMAEEQLANFSDFMRMNNLKGDRTLHNKLFGNLKRLMMVIIKLELVKMYLTCSLVITNHLKRDNYKA